MQIEMKIYIMVTFTGNGKKSFSVLTLSNTKAVVRYIMLICSLRVGMYFCLK